MRTLYRIDGDGENIALLVLEPVEGARLRMTSISVHPDYTTFQFGSLLFRLATFDADHDGVPLEVVAFDPVRRPGVMERYYQQFGFVTEGSEDDMPLMRRAPRG